jgi:L-aspartate oxidase
MTRIIKIVAPGPVVVGSGVAGLTAALGLGRCLVLTKSELAAGSSRLAQGGIAAAVDPNDSPRNHAADTLAVSAGLSDPVVAGLVTSAAPDRIRWLLELGARFDRKASGELVLGREAGHRAHRIVHADGDATGAELMRTLTAAVRTHSEIEVWESTTALDLLRSGGTVVGVLVATERGELVALRAPAVILATGGIGQVYAHTTNPAEVTGDGLAMAARAGAVVLDPEFVQFHPTALASSLDPMPLLTEALRGDSAVLVTAAGERYMVDEHPDAELAPRDVVARATWQMLQEGRGALLDATHVGAEFPRRFPTVFGAANEAGIDPRVEPIPVSPAAHYHMGGIRVDAHGRSSLPGLYAAGETAATGLHGANRLASNSLLEGLVFGARVAADVRRRRPAPASGTSVVAPSGAFTAEAEDAYALAALRAIMWRHVGVVRNEAGLHEALTSIDALTPHLSGAVGRNLLTVARLVTEAALARTESRGGHYRRDHPDVDPRWQRHTVVTPLPSDTVTVAAQRGAA